jgi:hypothetical protein
MAKTLGEYRELHELAMEIADDSAPCLLESNLSTVKEGDDTWWYDLESWSADEKTEMAGALRYCELRGLVVHHPEKPNPIQTLEL